MIKFEHEQVAGWEPTIRGMRNPMNSWDKSDSKWRWCSHSDYINIVKEDVLEIIDERNRNEDGSEVYIIGPNDRDLMKRLRNAGTDHRKFMRMIDVWVDITAPLYWWKEFDTYKVGTVVNSCSTMHKIHDKEFTLDDFSHERLVDIYGQEFLYSANIPIACNYAELLKLTIDTLNVARHTYLETKDKKYWEQMIQLLPTSYNQKRTIKLNYEVLANMYKSRKNHKLDEWHDFCDWCKELPYSELITGEFKDNA